MVYQNLISELEDSAFKNHIAKRSNKLISVYHAEVQDERQEEILREFTSTESTIRCLVVTNAFGMGVNIPDISLIYHWGEPESILSYWQQIGRGGRDGRQTQAVMLHNGHQLHSPVKNQSKATFKKLLDDKTLCIRYVVLSSLHLEGMDLVPQPPPICENKCQDRCQCSACDCCSGCRYRCKCNSEHLEK